MENPDYKVTTLTPTLPKTYIDLGTLEARDNLEQTNRQRMQKWRTLGRSELLMSMRRYLPEKCQVQHAIDLP